MKKKTAFFLMVLFSGFLFIQTDPVWACHPNVATQGCVDYQTNEDSNNCCRPFYHCVSDYVGQGPGSWCEIDTHLLLPPAQLVPIAYMQRTKDPINIFSGELFFDATDFSLTTRGSKFGLSRQYRSFATIDGLFGYGWRTDFDVNLTLIQVWNGFSTYVVVTNLEGTSYFSRNWDTPYGIPAGTSSSGNSSMLIANTDNTFTITDKHGKKSHYDLSGRLASVTDRNGNTLTFVYNPGMSGGTYIQDAGGRKIILNLDFNGHVTSAVDPAGKTFQYDYDVNGNLVKVTDPSGAVTNYTYDSNHKIIQFTNANGHKAYYQYDAQGRCVKNWRDNNVNTVSLDYQANNTTVVTDSLEKKNTYVFDDIGLLISHTDPLGAVTQQTWSTALTLDFITDANFKTTQFMYDSKGNLLQATDPFGNKTTMTYTADFNLISSKTDALGNVTKFTYDNNGNLTTVTDALGNTHSFVYDIVGNVISTTDSRGNATYFAYDTVGHMIQKTDALGHSTNFTYK